MFLDGNHTLGRTLVHFALSDHRQIAPPLLLTEFKLYVLFQVLSIKSYVSPTLPYLQSGIYAMNFRVTFVDD